MAEIKQNFSAGKMNKDLDERLIPKGQYRHAENIQISTSEDADVGAVENIISNKKISTFIPEGSTCVGVYSNEKENAIYWFVANEQKDMILQYKNDIVTIVLVDINKDVLKFDPNTIITGINTIDNLLFWTDNISEPKKINVDLCIQGSVGGENIHTKLIVEERDIDLTSNSGAGVDIREEHITVIKKAPKTKLTLVMDVEEDTTAELEDAPFTDVFGDLLPMAPGTVIPLVGAGLFLVETGTFINQAGPSPVVGDELLLLDSAGTNTLPDNYNIKLKILADLSGQPDGSGGTLPANTFRTKIVDGFVTLGQENWYVYKKAKQEDFFEKQFARFSYRYKYQDGEYSTFAPFSEIAFKPDAFDYETKKAYNLGMQNKLKELTLKNFVEADILEDVVQIDLLYKESNSPNVYIVETLKYNDYRNTTNNWDDNEYQINSDLIYAVLPSNQLLRPFDNVPRKALAQEITGNRIVYGNYVQNYNLTEKPVIDSTYTSRTGVTLSAGTPNKSLKSLRNYQLGISYLDEYGRETPVFSNTTSSFKIPKSEAKNSNALQFTAITSAPDWAKSYKIFVKETSNEYYNLAMDRVYRARDGNIWLSFPSSERNKIDEETFLILKKQLDASVQVEENLKYKVIAIESEAPVEVKTDTNFIAKSNGNGTIANLFTGDMPLVNDKYFQISEPIWKSDNGPSIDNISDVLSIKFRDTAANISSDFYEISYIQFEAPHYNITLKNKIKESDSWIFDNYANTTSFAASDLNTDLELRMYRNIVQDQPKFDGKFFVKILNDELTEKYVLRGDINEEQYVSVGIVSSFYLADTGADYSNTLLSLADLGGSGTVDSNVQFATDTKGDWVNYALKFNNDAVSSEWFIDHVYYASTQPGGNIESGLGMPSGFGKGIYKVTGGGLGGVDQWYMELSFSEIKPNAVTRFQGDAVIPRAVGSDWEGDLNIAAIEDPRNFSVGSSLNTEHDDQIIVSQLKQNKLFKFAGDQTGDKYIINGEVIKERRYNHTSYDDLDAAWQNVVNNSTPSPTAERWGYSLNNQLSQNSGSYNNSVVNPRGTLEIEYDKFAESNNRRITYIIPFAKYDTNPAIDLTTGAPIYDPAVTGGILGQFIDDSGTAYNDFINATYGADQDTARAIIFLEIAEGEDEELVSDNPAIWETEPKENIDLDIYYEASECFDISLHGTTQELDWFNCYSFNNGVESNRLRDDFNQIVVDKGAIASSTIDFVYEEENRKSGLIFSGLYNSINGINNLNQFIAAENITKDINPTYGSIQKLFSRNTDLVTFCEDKVIRILANKDAIFNADGNPNLVATPNVLGQTMPFSGDFGISNNPESFTKESYRAYFTDKNRGAVLRLSMDGLTPISDHDMTDFFKDNLQNETKLIGSYDEKKKEYNLTLPVYNQTVSFKEDVKGWVSFKSFVLEQGASVSNEYYTFKNGDLYKHHDADTRNNFYGEQYDSKVTTILNDESDIVKSFKTINYEGTQSYVNTNLNDNNYYNLSQKDGWKVENIKTDRDTGFVPEFVGKEGKWFNNIKGKNINTKEEINTSSFSFQGVGRPSLVEYFDVPPPVNVIVEVFIAPTTNCWFVTNNNNQILYKRGITGSSLPFDDPNEDASGVTNPNLVAEQIFGGNVYRQGETVNEIVQFKIRPGLDISSQPFGPLPIEATSFSARHLTPPGPDGERSRVFDIDNNFLQNIDISNDAGGAVEDIGVDQSTILNEANPLTSIPGPGFIGSTFSPISANVSFVDTDVPLSNTNHVLVNVPIKFTIPVVQDMDTIRIELYLEKDSLNI